jgi:hypothetical protein
MLASSLWRRQPEGVIAYAFFARTNARSLATQNEKVSIMPASLSPFTFSDKVEKCSAKFLAVCWFVRINFEVHRFRDGFSKSNALLLGQSLPTFVGHNLDKGLETERFSIAAICSSLFRCSSLTVMLSFRLVLFFLDFASPPFHFLFSGQAVSRSDTCPRSP